MTKFTDWSAEEVGSLMLGGGLDDAVNARQRRMFTKADLNTTGVNWGAHGCFTAKAPPNASSPMPWLDDVPETFDWRTQKNAHGTPIMTAVKNQGECGSCWAFAGVEVTESAWLRADFPRVGTASFDVACFFGGGL